MNSDIEANQNLQSVLGLSVEEARMLRERIKALPRAINGYDALDLLRSLSAGCKAYEIDSMWVGCTQDTDSGVWLWTQARILRALERTVVIQPKIIPAHAYDIKSYELSEEGIRFLEIVATMPSHILQYSRYRWEPNDQVFWTATCEFRDRRSVFPYMGVDTPDAEAIKALYGNDSVTDAESTCFSGPHSVRWIPPEAFGLPSE
jgi:hypothetical protein